MPLSLTKKLSDATLAIWQVDETLDELLSLLPDKGEMYLPELNRFTCEARKIEKVAVRVLLYKMTGVEKHIGYYPSGRPFLADGSYHISISHTKGNVAVIISKNQEVGIDIERRSERIHKVAHKFIRADEKVDESMLDMTTQRLLIWSAKEVLFKCIDTENVDFREHLRIEFPAKADSTLTGYEMCTGKNLCFHISYLLHEKFVMTWTTIQR